MKSNILIYQTEDGQTKIETHIENESVWLTQAQMSELFQKERSVISKHIGNVFKEGELEEKSNVQNLHIAGSDKPVRFYNLDVIISVGYRVKSHRGTQFRIWATQRLKEFLVKGFLLDDERMKNVGQQSYFEELLSRIRDIRSSEKVFWLKILDIYATSIDYDPQSENSIQFFKTVQNKMHWAAHGKTAAEVIFDRADASKPNMGLTNFKGKGPKGSDVEIAKNYLTDTELNVLNRMVTAYLEVAELQALNRVPMYMKDWVIRLNDFLTMTGKPILNHGGSISHDQALEKARAEYSKFKSQRDTQPSRIEKDFLAQVEKSSKLLKSKK